MDPIAAMYLTQALHGLAYGMLLFLVASGLTLIFGMMGVLNFAHASFFMLAAYFCSTVVSTTGNFWLALAIAPLMVGILGILVERFLLRRVHKLLGHLGQLLLTIGITLVVSEGIKIFWGTGSRLVPIPKGLDGLVALGALEYPLYRLFVIAISALILILLWLLLKKSRMGMIVRAAVSDPEMVSVAGTNTPRVFMFVFGFGTWLAGVAGVVAAPYLTVFPGLAEQIGMDAFVVVVVGGLGSLAGSIVASLLLGEMNAFGIQFLPRLSPILMFVFMAAVLSFKPTGLFGDRQ